MLANPDQLLLLGNRLRIYQAVEASPGIHLRALERTLSMPLGTLDYHLHQMTRAGLLHVRAFGRVKSFFANDGADRRDRDYLYYLRLHTPRQILVRALEKAPVGFSELAHALPISPSTLSFHLKKLVAAGMLTSARRDGKMWYTCVDPERVRRLLLDNKGSFADAAVDRFAAAFLDL